MSLLYETFERGDITADMLDDAAKLFTENYGIWGSASRLCGKRVTLTAKRIREQYLPQDGECWYTRVTSHGTLVGNAFTCRWNHGGRTICWVTQLVVHKEYRGKGIASTLLRMSMADSDDMYGIMSSHPYACVAATAVFGMNTLQQ
ncbi:acyl n-acyltransferase [Fusarium globosum]|uniref:Acyl n-acyltransferase n=1 Tax=Fusarium globosum TaxID=78864 RepID=A0A8H6CWN3_9HYPO|nr:acyl n-acyltransferase [Fusarium globosum]